MVEEYYIYLFRHGQTTFNRDGRFTGWMNPKLTEKGKRNAKEIWKQLKGKHIDLAFHSRLIRSKETLKIAIQGHTECKKIIEDDRIIERNYGDLNGTGHEEFIERIGKQLLQLDLEGDIIEDLDQKYKNKVERFLGEEEYEIIHRGYAIPPPGGESFKDVEKRVGEFIIDLKKKIKKEKVNVAISAHGNSIRLFRKVMEGASVKEATRWVIPYDKVFVYKVKG